MCLVGYILLKIRRKQPILHPNNSNTDDEGSNLMIFRPVKQAVELRSVLTNRPPRQGHVLLKTINAHKLLINRLVTGKLPHLFG